MKLAEIELLDLVMTGEAARICAVDRRTFLAKAKRMGILPTAVAEGRSLFSRSDVEKIAKKIRTEKEEKKSHL